MQECSENICSYGNVTVYIYDSTGAPIGYQAYANGAQTVAIGALAYNAFAIMIAPFGVSKWNLWSTSIRS